MVSSRPASHDVRFLYFAVREWGRKNYLIRLEKLIKKIIPVILLMRMAGFLFEGMIPMHIF
jgi:hypothetical protein